MLSTETYPAAVGSATTLTGLQETYAANQVGIDGKSTLITRYFSRQIPFVAPIFLEEG